MRDTTDDARALHLSRDAVDSVLNRAAELDRDEAGAFSVDEFRRAALEAGLSPSAVEMALREHALEEETGGGSRVNGEAPPSFVADMVYGGIGAAAGAAVVLGDGWLISVLFLGLLVATVHLVYRHGGERGIARLLREATVLWGGYSVSWLALGGDPWPSLFAVAPLGVILAGVLGKSVQLLKGSNEMGRLPGGTDTTVPPGAVRDTDSSEG